MVSLPPDDMPPESATSPLSDDQLAAFMGRLDITHPVVSGGLFLLKLGEDPLDTVTLKDLVTPESLDDWGDFSDAAAKWRSLNEPAFGNVPTPAVGAPDVVYMKLLEGVAEGYVVNAPTPITGPGVVTLVWRPERGKWLIHRIGEYALPEQLPRTSPGVAPWAPSSE